MTIMQGIKYATLKFQLIKANLLKFFNFAKRIAAARWQGLSAFLIKTAQLYSTTTAFKTRNDKSSNERGSAEKMRISRIENDSGCT